MTFQIDRFQGDPKIFITIDGAEMVFVSGQPLMDGGLENAVNISLLTKKGWYGNFLIDDPNKRVGSRYLVAVHQSITLSMLVDSSNAIKQALQWMVDSGIASNVEGVVSNPDGKQLQSIATVEPPGKDIEVLLLTKNGTNWIVQKLDPASGKVIE
jgi:phage gp46-like protein